MSEESENVIVDKHSRKHDKEKRKHRKKESELTAEEMAISTSPIPTNTDESDATTPSLERRKSRKKRSAASTTGGDTALSPPPAYETAVATNNSDDEHEERHSSRRHKSEKEEEAENETEREEAVAEAEKEEETKPEEEEEEKIEEKEVEIEQQPSSSANEPEFDEEKELEGLDDIDVTSELEGDGNDSGYDKHYLCESVTAAFAKLSACVQDKNLPAATATSPEIVFVGPSPTDKAALIESILGRPITSSASAFSSPNSSSRVVYHHVTSEKRRTVIKADAATPKDTVLTDPSTAALAAAIASRLTSSPSSSSAQRTPLHVEHSAQGMLRMTLVDTPALTTPPMTSAAEAAVLRELRVPGRLIVAVLPAAAAPASPNEDPVLRLVRRADPELGRTAVVYTGLRGMLEARVGVSGRALNRILVGAMPEVETFFVTLVHARVRRELCEASDDKAYRKRVVQYGLRDIAALNRCAFDRELTASIGAHNFARFVCQYVWAEHKKAAPRIPAALRARRAAKLAELDAALAQAKAIGSSAESDEEKKKGDRSTRFFRALAAQYAADLVAALKALVRGTAAGVPLGCGQTAEQERAECPCDGQWMSGAQGELLQGAEALLYGGQQFERLLSEFRIVCQRLAMPELSEDDVVVAAGSFKASSAQNLALAACDLARQKIEDLYTPLIDQLAERALYVLKRLVDVAAQIISSGNNNNSNNSPFSGNVNGGYGNASNNVRNVEQYNYFIHFIKEKYCGFVDAAGEHCKARCLEEFYPTHTVYWDITENETLKQIESTAQVRELAQSIFASLSARISKNILVKFYNFLLLPAQTELCAELQRDVAALSKEEIEELFEVENVNDDAMNAEISIKADIEELEELEKSAAESVSAFCHPKI